MKESDFITREDFYETLSDYLHGGLESLRSALEYFNEHFQEDISFTWQDEFLRNAIMRVKEDCASIEFSATRAYMEEVTNREEKEADCFKVIQ